MEALVRFIPSAALEQKGGLQITTGRAIVITGTPGVGKSVVAKGLENRTGFELIELNVVARDVEAFEGVDEERGAKIIKPRAVKSALRKKLKDREGTVIIEGHFGEVVPKELVDVVIVLRTSPIVLAKRLKERGYDEAKIAENTEAELLDSCLISAVDVFGAEKVFELDTTDLSPEEATSRIVYKLQGKQDGVMPAGSINWIARLEDEGKLEQLIRHGQDQKLSQGQ